MENKSMHDVVLFLTGLGYKVLNRKESDLVNGYVFESFESQHISYDKSYTYTGFKDRSVKMSISYTQLKKTLYVNKLNDYFRKMEFNLEDYYTKYNKDFILSIEIKEQIDCSKGTDIYFSALNFTTKFPTIESFYSIFQPEIRDRKLDSILYK